MRTKTLHHLLVDSRDRDRDAYPHPNTYRVTLPKTYKNVVSARLLSMALPTTFYVFTAAQNNTSVAVTVDSTQKTLTIDDGNYTPDAMVAAFKSQLTQAFPDNTFDVWYDAPTLRFNVTCLEGADVAVEVPTVPDGGPDDRSLAFLLGFQGTETSRGGTLTASSVMNTNPWAYVLLDIDELQTIDEGGLNGHPMGKGCFARIMVLDTFRHVYLDGLNLMFPPVPQCPPIPKLERLTVTFRTHEGHVVDFHGADHSFVLELVTATPGERPLHGRPALPPTAPAPPVARTPSRRLPEPAPVARRSYVTHAVVVLTAGAVAYWYWTRRRQAQ